MLYPTIVKEGEVNIIYLSGELTASTSDELTRLFKDLIADNGNQVVLEMSGLTYISSNGLRPLLEWLDGTKNSPGKRKLVLCCLQKFVAQVLSATGFDRKFPVFDSLEAAMSEF